MCQYNCIKMSTRFLGNLLSYPTSLFMVIPSPNPALKLLPSKLNIIINHKPPKIYPTGAVCRPEPLTKTRARQAHYRYKPRSPTPLQPAQ